MRLALFDAYRLGVVDGEAIRDVSSVLPSHDAEWPWPFVPRCIAAFESLRPAIERVAAQAEPLPLSQVRLLPPIPRPSNVRYTRSPMLHADFEYG